MKKIIIPLIGLLLLLTSCENITFAPDVSDDSQSVFDYLWTIADEYYSFFDVKNVDWDEVYTRYDAQIDTDTPSDTLFDILANMMNELKDGHVNLVSKYNISNFDISLLGPENIDTRVLYEYYLSERYRTGPFTHTFLHQDSIAYIRYDSFSNSFDADQLNFIFKRYENTQGLILDLRQNGGGNVNNVFSILYRICGTEEVMYHTIIKSGPDHDEFSEASVVSSSPVTSDSVYTGPVVVLIDRGSFSASSFFALCTKAFDNITLMGDTTGGGLGIPNGGQLPNGWTYRFSISRTLTPAGDNYENGVPPEIVSILDPAQTAQGIDNVIEDAVNYLINH